MMAFFFKYVRVKFLKVHCLVKFRMKLELQNQIRSDLLKTILPYSNKNARKARKNQLNKLLKNEMSFKTI